MSSLEEVDESSLPQSKTQLVKRHQKELKVFILNERCLSL